MGLSPRNAASAAQPAAGARLLSAYDSLPLPLSPLSPTSTPRTLFGPSRTKRGGNVTGSILGRAQYCSRLYPSDGTHEKKACGGFVQSLLQRDSRPGLPCPAEVEAAKPYGQEEVQDDSRLHLARFSD
ncbi:hypothetical protein OH76DRAFT_1002918 [Lentinus brumalis]|uniref:Uncharacterized protein n=1 Tax=Lentinus brumalis TaxID=2498619 RepID=A0A371DQN3_9APHY|nr:hypothetical protein OH76DRAFT_1002918 [Polyporus brumalis]